jgi:hypothetical protein
MRLPQSAKTFLGDSDKNKINSRAYSPARDQLACAPCVSIKVPRSPLTRKYTLCTYQTLYCARTLVKFSSITALER